MKGKQKIKLADKTQEIGFIRDIHIIGEEEIIIVYMPEEDIFLNHIYLLLLYHLF